MPRTRCPEVGQGQTNLSTSALASSPSTSHDPSVLAVYITAMGSWDSVYSRLRARRSVHSRSSPQTSIRSHSDYQHGQPSKRSVHSQLGSQIIFSTSYRSGQHGRRRETVTQSDSSSTGSLRAARSPARYMPHALQPRRRRVEHREERPRPMSHD